MKRKKKQSNRTADITAQMLTILSIEFRKFEYDGTL